MRRKGLNVGHVIKDLQFGRPKEQAGEMDTNIRELTIVWPVFRRTVRPVPGQDGVAAADLKTEIVYHWMGCASDEEKAVNMCRDDTYIIGPCPLNFAFPEAQIEWKGSYCPLAKKALEGQESV